MEGVGGEGRRELVEALNACEGIKGLSQTVIASLLESGVRVNVPSHTLLRLQGHCDKRLYAHMTNIYNHFLFINCSLVSGSWCCLVVSRPM
jgi:hypothetical protein